MDEERLLDEQLAYYRARAGEYDEWFLRTGRYDRGPAHRAEWVAEVAAVEAGLREAGPRGPRARARLRNGTLDAPPDRPRRPRHGGRRLAGGHRAQP